MSKIDKKAYADMFGPTTGDRVRLADTDLIIEVEKDLTFGSEVKFGGGKVIRDGQGQSQLSCTETVDTVITNALIVDYTGIYKADIGIKDGYIAAIGSAQITLSPLAVASIAGIVLNAIFPEKDFKIKK